ncbi:MAG: TIGR03619 family F420-dependent LLM class oxidoreductase, partial [Chloroflexota bacterium]
ILEALITLAYLAPIAPRVRLGVSVLVFPMRNPVLIAKEIASLDVLSDGRVILGVGAGWNEPEFRAVNAEFDNRGRRLNEAIRVLKTLWSDDDPQFDGEFTTFRDVLFQPKPVQPGGPPIWVGGPSAAALRRTALLADAWHPVAASLDDFARGMSTVRSLAQGRAVGGSLRIRVVIGKDVPDDVGRQGAVRAVLSGSTVQIIEKLMAYQAAGMDHLVADFSENTLDSILDGMRRFAGEIRPHLAES